MILWFERITVAVSMLERHLIYPLAILNETILHQVMSAKESLLVDCLASNPASKDFVSYQHVVQLLSE